MTETVSDKQAADFPYSPYLGANDGATRLALAYRAGALVMWSKDGDVSDARVEAISALARKVDAFDARSKTLSGSFGASARKYSEKAVSFTVENAVIFGTAAVGATLGPTAGIAGSATATYPQTLGNWFLKTVGDAGYDVKDSSQLKAAVNDPEFMKEARHASHVHAGQMSGAVLGAGMLAGYIYSAVAKPAAGISATVARSVLPRLIGERLSSEFAEKGVAIFGEALAKGVKSGANSLGRKVLGSATVKPYVRSLFLTAAMATTSIEAQAQYHDAHLDTHAETTQTGFPNYNTSLRYI